MHLLNEEDKDYDTRATFSRFTLLKRFLKNNLSRASFAVDYLTDVSVINRLP